MNFKKFKAVVIEDEIEIRKAFVRALKESGHFHIMGETGFVSDAVDMIIKYSPEVVFLDIELRGGEAFDVLDELEKKKIDIPPIVMNTAHTDHGYGDRVINYYKEPVIYSLTKPFWDNWWQHEQKILSKIEKHLSQKEKYNFNDGIIQIMDNNSSLILDTHEIICIKKREPLIGNARLIEIYISNGESYTHSNTLDNFLKRLPDHITKVNRREVVNLKTVRGLYNEINKKMIRLKNGNALEIGRDYRKKVVKLLDAMLPN